MELMDGSLAIQQGEEIYAAKEAEMVPKQTKITEEAKSIHTLSIAGAEHSWRRFRINAGHVSANGMT
jgi:ribosomal protein S8E